MTSQTSVGRNLIAMFSALALILTFLVTTGETARAAELPDTTVGQSVGFSGDDEVLVPGVSSQLAGDATWEVWVKPQDFDKRRVLLGTSYGGEGVLTLEPSGQVYFFHGSAGRDAMPYEAVTSAKSLKVGEWNHVVVTRMGSTVWLFLDGQLDRRKVFSVEPSASTLPLRIGAGYQARVVGGLDEVAVYERALSASEVAEHFAAVGGGDQGAYGSLVAGDGPLGHWRLDENTGQVAVDETGEFPGEYRGTPSLAEAGVTTTSPELPDTTVGQSVGFSGDDEVLVSGVSSQLAGDATWEVWVKPQDFDKRRVLLGTSYGGEGVLTLEPSGQVYFFHGSAGGDDLPYQSVRSVEPLNVGEWNHVVVTRAGSTVWLFLDGQLDRRMESSVEPSTSTLPLRIGAGYQPRVVGGLDEVAVYERALSAGEVAEHFTALAGGDQVAYGSLVAGDGPLGHWRLDENTGQVAVDETGAFPGQYRGTPSLGETGATTTSPELPDTTVGQSVGFSGDDEVLVPGVSSQLAGDSTWEVWVKPENFDQRRVLLGKSYGGEGVLTLEPSGQVYFFHGSAGRDAMPYEAVTSAKSLKVGEWNHVVVTRVGSTVWLFLDGQLDRRKVFSVEPSASTLPLRIGAGYLSRVVGGLDEVAVYERALSASEVAEHFAAVGGGDQGAYGSLVVDDGPLGYWQMDENTGLVAVDETGAFPGQYRGTPSLGEDGATTTSPEVPDTTAPEAPVGVSGVAGDGEVELAWDASGESDLAGYNVYRSETAGVGTDGSAVNGELVAAGTESFVDTDVVNGTEYFYVLTAVDTADNESDASEEVSVTPQAVPVAACSPISTLPCAEVVLETPVELSFDGTEGGLADQAGAEIGFTMVDAPSTRLPADGEPSIPEVPGYEPDLLEVTEDGLTVTATRGIQYAKPPTAAGTNTLINGLGVGVQPGDGVTTVTTTVVAPDFDTTASSEKGGLWVFLDEDNLFNVSVQNQSGSNVRVQFQRELNGVSTSAADEFNGAVFPEGSDVHLTLELDNEAKTAKASYQVGSGAVVNLGTFNDVPAEFFDGALLPDDETGPAVYAGVYATARNEATNAVTVTFGQFSVDTEDTTEVPDTTAPEAPVGVSGVAGDGEVELAWDASGESDLAGYNVYRSETAGVVTDGSAVNGELVAAGTESFVDTDVVNGTEYFYVLTAVDTAGNESDASEEVAVTPQAVPVAACSPISTLSCADVVLETPVELSFDGTEGGLADQAGAEIGFTMVDAPSTRLPADGEPSIPEVPGYEPDLLEVTEDGLTVTATRGIQYAKSPPSTGTNTLINGLGVGVQPGDGVTTVTTTVVAPDFDATADSEKGGLWYFVDEDNLFNVSVQNQSGSNVRVQFQRELNGVSTAPADEFNGAVFPEGSDVHLTLELDSEAKTAKASYQVGSGAVVNLGTFNDVPAAFFDGALLPDDETGPAVYAGVYATARNEATNEVTVTFGQFSVDTEDSTEVPNAAPEVLLTGERTLFEGQDVIIPVGSFDEDGDDVELSMEGLPEGLTFDGEDITGTLAQDTLDDSPYVVSVTGDDGIDTSVETFEITVVDDVALDINFQIADAPTPAGYIADTGSAYGDRGDGLEFGWIEQGGDTPLDMTKNGRDRDRAGIDQLLDTFMHLQYGDIENPNCTTNQCAPGAWEISVPNGLYEVTLSVGDQPSSGDYDSLHALNVEGGVIIREFQATAAQEFLEATAFAGVTDGKLTVNAIGGVNTKINYINIRSVGTQPFATTTIPANRATNVVLSSAVSTSVSVPGSGMGVDPDKDTSLNHENVKVFEVTSTGDVEVDITTGSTGGNDTIGLSPTAPLKPNTTYRAVIDGVLDEAGQRFERFEWTFTTGEDEGGGGSGEFEPVEGVNFEKVLLPTASGSGNGKYFASLKVHQGYLWATTIGQGMFRYEILEDGTLGAAEDLDLFKGRAAVGLMFDEDDPDLAWVTNATANLGGESAKFGSKLSVVDFGAADPVVEDVFINLPRSAKDHLSNSLSYGPSGDGGDSWMYFLQGSNQAAGDVDGAWGRRGETQLTAAVLRFDPQDALASARADGPIDVKTEELGGTYDPYADGAPLEIYATGIRNAYDLLWHSNGHIYVPTNGTAGGANSPGVQVNGDGTFTMVSNQQPGENGYGNGTDVTDECTTRRIDGEVYSGGNVPPLSNLPTQTDWLFDVEQDGYYGHPNPTRCEWVLNDGTAYTPDRAPDTNYKGDFEDMGFNKSPNGVIEYTSETFEGALKGRMMVVRFSANDDIVTYDVANNGDLLGSQGGTEIPGFTGFVDPLDLTEDTEVNPGNIYINQYNRDGQPQQLFLLRVPEDQQTSTIQVTPEEGILSATLNTQRPTDTLDLTVTNAGADEVTVTGTTSGTHAAQFSVESPVTIASGDSAEVTVTFDPSGNPGVRTGNVVLSTGETSKSVSVRALAFAGEQGGNEPTLQQVADTFEWGITTGWTGLAGGTDPGAKGDEVLEPLFERASDGPVTMTPVAAFAPQENLPFGWYAAAEGAVTTTVVGTVAIGQLQKLNPQLASGGTSFDPGEDAFGVFYESNTFNRIGYSEDNRNAGSTVHRARIYPLEGNRFLVAFEDADNGDYQDYVFVLDNVKAAGEEPVDPPVEGEPIQVNFQTESAPVPEGYLRDFGQPFGERTGENQGTGLSYGWLDSTTLAPKDIVTNGRDRNLHSDQRKDTLIHMDLPVDATGGIPGEATWELEVPDGTYQVEVSVGDAQNGGAVESHTVNIEGTNAIDAFPRSSAANGSEARHLVATVTVEVTDGALTVDQDGGENTKINYLDITPLIEEEPEPQPSGDPVKVNFQSESAAVPDGYLRDFGQAYGARTGSGQGEGQSYGWIDQSTKAPLNLSENGRDRDLNSDQRLDTLMHMALPENSVGSTTPGSWEIAVEEGTYQVTVSVGDPSKGDAPESHTVHVEGVTAIDSFPNSAAAAGSKDRHGTGTATVEVLDGKLTLDQIGGVNTKINYVDIVPVGDGAAPQLVAQVNFQPAASDTPAGWVADTGALFTAERGYGWVGTEGGAAKTADTRERTGEADPIYATLMIVDDSQVPAVVDGEWEYALPDGEYTVELSVGDPGYTDSVHALTAEGVTIVDDFEAAANGDYFVGEQTVEVTDGALTLASTGHNTKLQWVRITTNSAVDIVPPQVSISLDGEGSGGTYTGPVTVTVDATDRHLEFVDYSVNDGEVQNYTEPFQVTGTGSHTVEVTATDGAGNATTKSATFAIVELGAGDITVTNPEAAPFHDRIVMSRIQSTTSNPVTAKTGKVILGNEGTEPIEVVDLDIADPNAFTLVDEPTLPATIPVGGSLTVTVEFIGTGSGQNTNFESELVVRHNGADGPSTVIELGAIWQIQSEGGNEPNVAEIVQAYGVGTTIVGQGQNLNNQGRLEAIGDEVLSATWKRADTSKPVTVRQLGAYHTCCNNTATFFTTNANSTGGSAGRLTHNGAWAQSLLPRISGSATNPAYASFTPSQSVFSMRIDGESSDWNLNNKANDRCLPANPTCQLGHHFRTWPVEDRDGEPIPGMFLAVMDYSGINYDFNDNVYLMTNVEPANPVQP